MDIIEQSLIAKNPQKKSEDGLVVTNDFIAVIDGSTSKATRRYSLLMSNGRYAMKIISRYIRKMPADISCHQFCLGVTRAIHRHYGRRHLAELADHPEERMTASVIIFSCLRREIWMIGDCMGLLNGELLDNPKPYEQVLAELRAAKVKELLASGRSQEELLINDEARASIIPRMLEEMKGQNKTYSVVDGFPIPERLVPVITLDFRPWEIVFASDGYPVVCPTLADSEAQLAHQRETDPLNIGEFKATKAFTPGNNSFDDRTYIRFTV